MTRQSIGFCNIIASYIENGDFKTFCLGLIKLTKADGLSIARKISERLELFGIAPKFITTDGASNMMTMSKHGGFLQQKCLVHGIQLVVTELIFSKKNHLTDLPELDVDNDDSNTSDVDDDTLTSPSSEDSEFGEENNTNEEEAETIEIFDENGKIKFEYSNLIKKVRTVMVFLKRSTKHREVVKKYTGLSPVVDVCTRWNSTLHMLQRFARIIDALRKGSIDSPELAKRVKFSNEEELAIHTLIKVLMPFDLATKNLSKKGTNLHMADIILQILLSKIENDALHDRTLTRILERREVWSDVLLFLKTGFQSIYFYSEPSDDQIIQLYYRVICYILKFY